MRGFVAALALSFLVVPSAIAGLELKPSSFTAGSEAFITVYSDKLGDVVVYDGEAGKFEVEVNSRDERSVTAWVPAEILNIPGRYSLILRGDGFEVGPGFFEVLKPDSGPLVLQTPDPVVASATSRSGASVSFQVWALGGNDPSPTVTCTPASGSLFPMGPSTSNCVATNRDGERAEGSVSIYVVDDGSPRLSLPDRLAVLADNLEGAYVSWKATAEDDIDGELEVTCDPKPGSFFRVGLTDVQCHAFDSSFNTTTGSFTVEVVTRETKLMLVLPDPIVAEATSREGAAVEFEVTAHGTADPNPVIVCDPKSGSTFGLGETKVVCTATDSFGETTEGSFTVTVVDTTGPAFLLQNYEAEATNSEGAEVKYEAIAEDLVDGSVGVRCSPESGSLFPLGVTQVECTAADSSGNSSLGLFYVTVFDTMPPHIASVKVDPDVLVADGELQQVRVDTVASDVIDPVPQCSVFDVTAVDADFGPEDWQILGSTDVELRGEHPKGADRIYTLNVRCVDQGGNAADGSVDVTVKSDSTSPSTQPAPAPSQPTKRRAVGRG